MIFTKSSRLTSNSTNSSYINMSGTPGQDNKPKAELIAERQANLPLPDQPPVASDWNSADASTVNVGSGGQAASFSHGNDALREPATGDSAVRSAGATLGEGVGREGKDNLGGIPNDAVTRDAKNKSGTVDTTK